MSSKWFQINIQALGNHYFQDFEKSKIPPETVEFHHQNFDFWPLDLRCRAISFGSHEPQEIQDGLAWYMVRSTLLQLPPRGALRAILGGPLAVGFFRLQPKVFIIKSTSRNKSFFVPRVSNHEKSDGDHYFLPSAREISRHDQLWGHFWGHYVRKQEKKHQEPSGMHPNDFQSIFKWILMIIFN